MESRVDVLVASMLTLVPAPVMATVEALKAKNKLEKAMKAYLTSVEDRKAASITLEKKTRGVLTDAGMAKSNAMDLIGKWSRVSIEDQVPQAKEYKQSSSSKKQDTAVTPSTKPLKERKHESLPTKDAEAAEEHASALEAQMALLAIRATSQESRFHTESITTATKEVDLKDVNLFVGERQLLTDAHVRIKEGVKYGLVGRNGAGKSTLLRALGDGLVPGLPSNVKILLVSQLNVEEMIQTMSRSDARYLTTLQVVLQGDKTRVRAEKQVDVLTQAIDSAQTAEVERVVKLLWTDQAYENLEEARRISSKRSGARGKEARKRLIEAEKRYEDAKANFVEYGAEHDWEQEAATLHAHALDILQETDAATVVPRAHSILRGLGFTAEMIEQPYENLSGGWRSRCSLASALLLSNHILLLDEPINFLDLPSILWLEWFIQQSSETVVTVAHDQEFLNNASNELIIIRKNKLEYFDGNLADYTRTKRRQLKHALKQQSALDKKKELMEKSIQEGMKQARKTGDDNRMRMAKSRQKKLDERWGLERNAAGHRFKLNRDLGGYYLTSRADIEIDDDGPPVRYTFPDPDPLPFAASLLHLENISFQHERAKKPLLKEVNITVDIGDRIGLVGPNGHGKTTLLSLIVGERMPTSGTIQKHARLRMAYYAQQAISDPLFHSSKQTALQHFMEHCAAQDIAQEARARGFLAQFDLKGRTVDAMPIGKLSGGQRVKLLLAEVVSSGPHLLILDEVTTHMDAESIKALIFALKAFRGAVILISHDRHAIKEVIEGKVSERGGVDGSSEDDTDEDEEGVLEDDTGEAIINPSGTAQQRRTFLVRNGRVKALDKGVEQYVESVERTMEAELGSADVP